jgi:hypothetical protein
MSILVGTVLLAASTYFLSRAQKTCKVWTRPQIETEIVRVKKGGGIGVPVQEQPGMLAACSIEHNSQINISLSSCLFRSTKAMRLYVGFLVPQTD